MNYFNFNIYYILTVRKILSRHLLLREMREQQQLEITILTAKFASLKEQKDDEHKEENDDEDKTN